ncbi:MAG: hypothetical protein IT328_22850 [Caldilineaceae bacterium]|nr:hypothetical protein [Caldilineaceae bacterium]
MRLRRVFLTALIGGLFLCLGNLPAPYYACEGKAEGDRCNYGYGCATNGTCRLLKECIDDPNTEINECLVCNTGG